MRGRASTSRARDVAAAFAAVRGAARAARSLAHGRSRAGGAPRSRRVPARRAAEGQPAAGRGRDARAPSGSCCAAPTPSSGCAAKATRSCTTPKTAALVALGRIWKRVGELAAIDPRFAPYLEARDGIKAQLEDLAFTLRDFADGIDASPERLQQVEDRLALIERLKRKHGGTLEEAIAHRDRLAAEHKALTGGQSTVAEIEQQLADAGRAFLAAARTPVRQPPRRRAEVRAGRSKPSSPSWRWSGPSSRCGSRPSEAEGQWTRRRHRQRRALPVAERRRGPAAAGQDRLGRRAVARHAGAEDPRRDGAERRRAGRVRQDAHLRRGRCRHRRARRHGGRAEAGVARRPIPGALHHAPAADRGVRPQSLPDRKARPGRPDRDQRQPAGRRGSRRRNCPDDGRRGGGREGAGERARVARYDAGERRKRKAKVATGEKSQAQAQGRKPESQ